MKVVHKMPIIFGNDINPAINQLTKIIQFKINVDFETIYQFIPDNDLVYISPFISKAKNFLEREAKISLELIPDKTIGYFIRLFYG